MALNRPTAVAKENCAFCRPTLYTYVEMISLTVVLVPLCIRYTFSYPIDMIFPMERINMIIMVGIISGISIYSILFSFVAPSMIAAS